MITPKNKGSNIDATALNSRQALHWRNRRHIDRGVYAVNMVNRKLRVVVSLLLAAKAGLQCHLCGVVTHKIYFASFIHRA